MTKLTAAKVESLRPLKRAKKYFDQNGLILRVQPSGTKQWVWRGTVDGKRRELGLGSVSLITLKEAREKAFEYRKIAYQGGDPKPTTKKTPVPTFAEAARECFDFQRSAMKKNTARAWFASLRMYAFPYIGGMQVDQVTTADVMNCLKPIWAEKSRTARSVRQRIGKVMCWAIAQNHLAHNPAGDALSAILPKNGETRHHPAMPYRDIRAAFQTMRRSGASAMAVLCLQFVVLTTVRDGAVCAARWDEIDFKGRVWEIPTMKGKKDILIPLPKRVIKLLREAKKLGKGSDLVFPSATGKPLRNEDLSAKLLKKYHPEYAVHGFRSSFRDWGAENGIPQEVLEASLIHRSAPRNQTEAAYLRTDLLEARREVVERWATAIS